MRIGHRKMDEMRPYRIECDYLHHAQSSALVSLGNTRVIVTAYISDGVPSFLSGQGRGWLTAEYAMLPCSVIGRKSRERIKPDGRSVEIQRLIGRSLRCAVDFSQMGERTMQIDCDVIDADGGTRTACITGAYCVAYRLFEKMVASKELKKNPMICQVGAVSVGILDDMPILDLCYEEDSRAQVDMNVVMTSEGDFIEVQGTGEGRSFSQKELDSLLALAKQGMQQIFTLQRLAIQA